MNCKLLKEKVALDGVEPPAHGLGNRCSIHLSYRAVPIAECGFRIAEWGIVNHNWVGVQEEWSQHEHLTTSKLPI